MVITIFFLSVKKIEFDYHFLSKLFLDNCFKGKTIHRNKNSY